MFFHIQPSWPHHVSFSRATVEGSSCTQVLATHNWYLDFKTYVFFSAFSQVSLAQFRFNLLTPR